MELGISGWENAKAVKINKDTYDLYLETVKGKFTHGILTLSECYAESYYLVVGERNTAIIPGTEFHKAFMEPLGPPGTGLDIFTKWVNVYRRRSDGE